MSKEKKESEFVTYASIYDYDYESAKISLDFDSETFSLTAGVDAFNGNMVKESSAIYLEKKNIAGFIMGQFELNDLTLKAGYRYENIDFKNATGENEDESWNLLDNNNNAYARMPKDGLYFDFIRTTMAANRIDPKAFKPRDTVRDEDLDILAKRGQWLYENTDKAILGWGASISVFGLSALLSDNITQGSLDEWLCMLMTEKQTANDMMSRYVDAVIKCLKVYHEAVGDTCFAWGIASDDAGTQRGEVIAPELFTEMIKPHYKRLCDWVHAHTNWKTYLHSCGSIYHYIPEWIDAGIDILNPVQISAANMEPERLIADYSGRIVFWGGGCDTQQVLPLGTPEAIRDHVRHNLSVFASGSGGYVFTQVHNIQQNVPAENVEAMFAAVREFG